MFISQDVEAKENTRSQGVDQHLQKYMALPQPVVSQYTDYYNEKMEYFANLISKENETVISKRLQENEIKYNKESSFHPQFEVIVKTSTINQQIIILTATWALFSMDVKILNVDADNTKHADQMKKGQHGKIYQCQFKNKFFVIKCIPIRSKFTRKNALKQWFIARIASVFEIGPFIENIFGFDILMYQNCIQFPMEICKEVDQLCFNVNMLLWNMALMHSLHLVHCDIKPQNIMLSPHHKKTVFIDFGLSKFIKENIGSKSMTQFVGTLNFSSKQMSNCFFNETVSQIDLYYNDLICLEKTIGPNKIRKKYLQEKEEICLLYNHQWAFFHLYLLKYYLFTLKLEQFQQSWKNFIILKSLLCYKSDIFQFFLELNLNEQIKEFFWKFVSDEDLDTDNFSRIKLIFEIFQENPCLISMRKNQQKFQHFNSYRENCLIDQNYSQTNQENKKKAMTELVLSKTTIKNIPLIKYIDVYLQYMSYKSSKFDTNATKRQQAAKVYYSMFISQPVPADLSGRKIIEATIVHILEWCFQSYQLKQDADEFAIFVFRLFDFISILDIGSAEETLGWFDRILNHQSLIDYYKEVFLIRVVQSLYLHSKRPVKKGSISRFEFIQLLSEWVVNMRKIRKLNSSKNCHNEKQNKIQKNCYFLVRQSKSTLVQSHYLFSQKFIAQFGQFAIVNSEIMGFRQYFRKQSNKDSQLYVFGQILSKNNGSQWSFFTLEVFSVLQYQRNSISICEKIYSIFKKCIADEQILAQLSFQFELKTCIQLFNLKHLKLRTNTMNSALNFLNKIQKQDLLLFIDILITLHSKIILKKYFEAKSSAYLACFTPLFNNFIQSMILYCKNQLYSSSLNHKCMSNSIFHYLIVMIKTFKQKEKKFKQTFNIQKLQSIYCLTCKTVLFMNLKLNKMQQLLELYYIYKNEDNQLSASIAQDLFSQSDKVLNYFSEKTDYLELWFDNAKIALRYCQLICCPNDDLEEKYHGVLNYYNFAIAHNSIKIFFQPQYQNSFPILKTLFLLKKEGKGRHIQFMMRLIQHLEESLLVKDYYIIVIYCTEFFNSLSEDQLCLTYCSFKRQTAQRVSNNNQTAVIYGLLYKIASCKKLQKSIISGINKTFSKLHYRFQRSILIIIYYKARQNVDDDRSEKRKRRKWLLYNNRLCKMLEIQGNSKSLKKRHYDTHSKIAVLKSKARKIGKMNLVKFETK